VSRPTHADACASFRWNEGFAALGWTRDGDVDLGATIVDRHAGSGRLALRWIGKDGRRRDLTFDELADATSRFANLLRALGVTKGDRVAGYLPRVPETIVAMIGAWKVGAIWVPIFTGFGSDAIRFRVEGSEARVVCTHADYRAHVPKTSATIVTIDGGESTDVDFFSALAEQSSQCASTRCRRDDPAVLLYTSGSTGPPKGVAIAANFPLAVHPYMSFGLGLRADDVFWPTGDPGWGYGLVCYMAALARGVAVLSHESAPAADYVLSQLEASSVTNLATTPTLLRGIMALGDDTVRRRRVLVQRVSSCGEPLNAEVVSFFRGVWNVTVADHYGSSEFGLPIGNANALEMNVKPGSMGLPFPGLRMAVVDDDGCELPPDRVGQIGMAPSTDGYYALGYWRDDERTREMSRGGWITIGDLARRDGDGYFWFEGRADDVIKSAGYRIGPFEVESALLTHPAVAEAAVVGKPDALRGEIVKAFVVLKRGVTRSTDLEREMIDAVRASAGRHTAPREIEFVDHLPKTETGKIQRFQLRQREQTAAAR
jgi:acetyl-CoA synthetase